MKLRERLSLSFSIVASFTLLFFGLAMFFFFSEYRKSEFNNRLKQRVEVTEKMFLERENFSDQAFRTIQEQFLNKLPEETEEVVELTEDFREKLKLEYPESFLETVTNNEEAFFERNDRQGSGKIFHVGGKDYLVLLTAKDDIGVRLMDHFLAIIFIGLAICIIAMVLVSYFVSGWILNPILQKISQANSISASNLHDRLDVGNAGDEMSQLAIAFNNLLDRVAEAFDTQRSFIDSASHEIRNPLTTIIGEAEFALQRERTKEEYIHSLSSISEEADRLNTLVNSLLKLSGINTRKASYPEEVFAITDVLQSAISKLHLLNPDQKVIVSGAELRLKSKGNIHLIETAFINLLDNACKFSFNKPVEVTIADAPDDNFTVTIKDRGIGIPPEDIPKVTQPFHRAHNARKITGIGIGIPLTAKIIELHHGSLAFHSELGVGTEVKVVLPKKPD